MTKLRVLICDELAPEALEVFAEHGIEAVTRTKLSEAKLIETAPQWDGIVVRSATRITRPVLAAGTRLGVVGRAGVGVDNIDLEAATEHGVLVVNAPAGNTNSTAELALAHLFSLARNLPAADRAVREGRFASKQGLMGTEIQGKTLGVIGLGRIGRAVAQRALGLSMHVVAFDPFLAPGASPLPQVELCSLEELLERSDFVSLHVPLTDSTRHMLGGPALARMKRGARLINCARGGLVDEQALAQALAGGHLRGAALDVFEVEPPPADHPLLGRMDVVFSPHLGASSSEAQRLVALEIAREVSAYLLEGVASGAVNAPPMSRNLLREIAPWVRLLERVGSMLAQRAGSPLSALELELAGAVAELPREHLRLALMVGVLRTGANTPVNYVRAPLLAQERGLTLAVVETKSSEFVPGSVRVTARERGGGPTQEIQATILGRNLRAIRIDGVDLELNLSGTILISRHADLPGSIGSIGSALGDLGVNIRRLELGPAGTDSAFGFWSLYGEPQADLAERVRRLACMQSAQLVRLPKEP